MLGFSSACSGFGGGRAHDKARRVRVDVALGERDLPAPDVEAAALPEERPSLSEGARKVLPSAMEESSGKWQVLGFGECSGFGVCACAAFGWRLV